jgi:putative ABC transport system permease protein
MHDWRADIRARLSSARLHPQDEAEMVEEVGQHLEDQFAELAPKIGAGPARERLLAQLGNQEFDEAIARRRRRAKPTRARTWSSTSLWRDVRYGARSLRRSPGMVAAGTAALALGIGLTAVMYSVIYGMLIKGLPFENADRIALIYYADPARQDDQIPLADFIRYRQRQQTLDVMGGYFLGNANVSGGDRPDRVQVARMTAGTIDVTGVRPMLGRTFIAGDNDPGAPPTSVLSHSMWRDRYGADSSVVGKTLRVNGRPHTIIGVMPERFEFPLTTTKAWLALQTNASTLRPGEGPGLTVVGRLRARVAYERARAEFATLSRQLATERPPGTAEREAVVQPFVRGFLPARVYTLLYAMLGAVLMVLLVACANVANLLLDRAVGRTREVGIRAALGASRLAVVRQSLVESAILALLAAVVGSGLAQVGISMFNRAMDDAEGLFWMDVRLHPAVLAFVLIMAVFASMVSGLLPAMQSVRLDVSAILKDESHAASSLRVGRLSRMIVAVEIALSTTLILASGFITKSIVKLRTLEPGFATADVFTASVTLTSRDTVRRRAFFETLEHELTAIPGVAGAYLGSGLPGTGWGGDRVAVEGRVYARDQDYPSTYTLAVSPGFFDTFGVRVLRGRPIRASDRLETPRVVVVSEGFARRHFPSEDPIGRRIRLGERTEGEAEGAAWLTIVGVMPTLYAASFNLRDPWPPEAVTAFWQERDVRSASIAMRGPPDIVGAAPIRKIVSAFDPEVPVYDAASMEDVLARPTGAVHLFGTMFVIFGVASLVLAAIGLYAVMAFSVSRRVRELGIRMALGASSGEVIRMVCRQGALQILIGMSVGLVAGGAVVRLARAVLFDVRPNDPVVFVVVGAVLGMAAFVACVIPALRATRVDPLIALRSD